MKNTLYLVVPCYNEEEVLEETKNQLIDKIKELVKEKTISKKSKILFVNDGSTDETWNLICQYEKESTYVTGISLSHNQGHQNALLAGLLTAKEYADVVISIDADLQDDIQVIDKMLLEYFENEKEIVYGVRSSRKKDSFMKRFTAESFYHFMKCMGVDLVFNHADFRLTSKRVLEHLAEYPESHLFLRGIFPQMGFSSSIVFYERLQRTKGKSKYSFRKMISLAMNGITSFSTVPLKLISKVGYLFLLVSIILLVQGMFHVIQSFWILFSIWFVGGSLLISLGLIGEYLGRVYMEIKGRPRYIIEKNLLEEPNE